MATLSRTAGSHAFLRAFMEDPVAMSSLIPTSRYVADRIIGKINGDARKVVMEYGPGDGAVTKRLLEPGVLTEDSRVILIERSEILARELEETIDDKRVTVRHDSAENAARILHECGEERADHILLSIPLSTMEAPVRERILQESRELLHEEGSLIAFLFHPKVRGFIRSVFPDMHTEWEPRNLPPLFVMEAKK